MSLGSQFVSLWESIFSSGVFLKVLKQGEEGERGRVGERGPKGDHGQDGETGARGPTNKLALVGYAILTVFVVLSLYGTHQNDVLLEQQQIENCQVAKENRHALRTIFIDAAKRTASSSQRTKQEKKDAKEFYDNALSLLPPIDCKNTNVSSVGFRGLGLDFRE